MNHQTSVSPKGAVLSFDSISVFRRFQWVNHPQVVDTLRRFLKPEQKGRKGYGKVLLFRWLMCKWLMRCSYRDLESMSGIDYSTFIKFRKRLMASFCLPQIFETLATELASHADDLRLILDSSFVETYSKHDEEGSEYNGHKEKNGFKVHTVIDFKKRLPVLQIATPGARSDVRLGHALIGRAPPDWNVRLQNVLLRVRFMDNAIVFNVHSFWWANLIWYINAKRVRGTTNGNVILLGPLEEEHDLHHELIHVQQYMRRPFIHPFLYIAEVFKHGASPKNKYEEEAYRLSDSVYRGNP